MKILEDFTEGNLRKLLVNKAIQTVKRICLDTHNARLKAGGVLPYMGYIGMCGPKGYGFSAILVINWVSILAILPPFWS